MLIKQDIRRSRLALPLTARRVHPVSMEAGMRGWFFLGVAFFLMAVIIALQQSREDEEMMIRLGDRDLRSLPT
jgi:hypothetical protein